MGVTDRNLNKNLYNTKIEIPDLIRPGICTLYSIFKLTFIDFSI